MRLDTVVKILGRFTVVRAGHGARLRRGRRPALAFVPLLLPLAALVPASALRQQDAALDPDPPATLAAPSAAFTQAAARSSSGAPTLRLVTGLRRSSSDDPVALAVKVKLYKALLARAEEARDPALPSKATEELRRRRPLRATVEWKEPSGPRRTTFVVEDGEGCALADDASLTLSSDELMRHPCLAAGTTPWEEVTMLTIRMTPVHEKELLWTELLRDLMGDIAAEAHLARLNLP